MFTVGLTGNVAAGKSTVARWFGQWGATVIDADQLARDAEAPGTDVLRQIAQRFGTGLIQADGSLDRAALRHHVMADSAALQALNAIVHPAVDMARAAQVLAAKERGDCVVVHDIPLLFEVLDPKSFDLIVLVDAPVDVRRQRLEWLRGLDAADAERMIAAQMPSGAKRAHSHLLLENDGTLADLEARAHEAWRAIRKRAALHHATHPGPMLLVFAHPDDESYAIAGTVARATDANLPVHLICATDGEAARNRGTARSDAGLKQLRRTELDRSAELLGIGDVRRLGMPDKGLKPNDPAGIGAVRDAIRSINPTVIITFDQRGLSGHPDHVAVHHWAKAAWHDTGSEARLWYFAIPASIAAILERTMEATPDAAIGASVDVRPWGDVQRAAIAAHVSQRYPFDLNAAGTRALLERDRYVMEGAAASTTHDLFNERRTEAE